MSISRGTVWRLLQNARKKATQALSGGRSLNITEDNITIEKKLKIKLKKIIINCPFF
jgi:predicted DNA-binding protein (UPF0251 family)